MLPMSYLCGVLSIYNIHSERYLNLVVAVHIFLDNEGGAAEHGLPGDALLQTQLSGRPDHLVNEIERFVKKIGSTI